MAMLELVQNSLVSVKVRSPQLESLLACDAGTVAGVDDVSAVPPRVRRNKSLEHTPSSSGCWVRLLLLLDSPMMVSMHMYHFDFFA